MKFLTSPTLLLEAIKRCGASARDWTSNITLEQEALLNGLNYQAYPSLQELRDKGNNNLDSEQDLKEKKSKVSNDDNGKSISPTRHSVTSESEAEIKTDARLGLMMSLAKAFGREVAMDEQGSLKQQASFV